MCPLHVFLLWIYFIVFFTLFLGDALRTFANLSIFPSLPVSYAHSPVAEFTTKTWLIPLKKKPSVSTYFTRCTLQRDQLMSDSNAVSKSNFQGVFQFILDLTAAGQWQLCADSQLSFRWDRSALISVVLPTSAQRLPNPTLYNQHIITLFFPRLVCMPRCIKQFLNQKY